MGRESALDARLCKQAIDPRQHRQRVEIDADARFLTLHHFTKMPCQAETCDVSHGRNI